MASKDTKKINLFLEDPTQRRKDAKEKFANNNFAFFAPLRLCVKFSRKSFLVYSLLLFVFVSCRTFPKTADAFFDNKNSLPLENGASLYIFADVKEVRQIINILPIEELKDKQTKQMIDRTAFLAAALFSQESGKRFQLAAFGNYPSSQADFALSVNSGWQKQRSKTGGSYWYSQANRLSIALDRNQAFIAASLKNEPCDPLTPPPGAKIPEGFQEFRNNSPLSFWLENPAPIVNRILSSAGVPLRSPIKGLFIKLFPSTGKNYEAVIRLQFENPSHARGMSALLNLAAGLAPDDLAKLFFANPPMQNGNNVDIKTALLGEKEITMLFALFGAF